MGGRSDGGEMLTGRERSRSATQDKQANKQALIRYLPQMGIYNRIACVIKVVLNLRNRFFDAGQQDRMKIDIFAQGDVESFQSSGPNRYILNVTIRRSLTKRTK